MTVSKLTMLLTMNFFVFQGQFDHKLVNRIRSIFFFKIGSSCHGRRRYYRWSRPPPKQSHPYTGKFLCVWTRVYEHELCNVDCSNTCLC